MTQVCMRSLLGNIGFHQSSCRVWIPDGCIADLVLNRLIIVYRSSLVRSLGKIPLNLRMGKYQLFLNNSTIFLLVCLISRSWFNETLQLNVARRLKCVKVWRRVAERMLFDSFVKYCKLKATWFQDCVLIYIHIAMIDTK